MNPGQLISYRSSPIRRIKQIPTIEDRNYLRRKGISQSLNVRALAQKKKEVFTPPTVAETKARFAELHTTPIPNIYDTVVLELLVQQHFIKHNRNYKYEPIFALGFISAFDQILEGFETQDKDEVLSAYLRSLDEDISVYKSDASKLESACKELDGGLDSLLSEDKNANNFLKQSLIAVARYVKNGEFFYSKLLAIGLFRVLELTGFKDPKALERLVSFTGIELDFVNRDLKLYKKILTRLSAAKEMVKEVADREKKKALEREAASADSVPKEEDTKSAEADVPEKQA